MRQALGILAVTVYLLAPLHEWSHHHGPDVRDSDCVACQFHHAAITPPAVGRAPEIPLQYGFCAPTAPRGMTAAADPLSVAPKTSPPQPQPH